MTDGEIRASYRQAKYPEQQLKILSQLTGKSIGDIMAICGFSEKAIKEYNLHTYKPRPSHMVWTDEEVEKLRTAYRFGFGIKKIAKLIDRTNSSVQSKIYDLKSKGQL